MANVLLQFSQKSKNNKDELRVENDHIFNCLQNSLINVSLIGLKFLSILLYLYQVFIYKTYILS